MYFSRARARSSTRSRATERHGDDAKTTKTKRRDQRTSTGSPARGRRDPREHVRQRVRARNERACFAGEPSGGFNSLFNSCLARCARVRRFGGTRARWYAKHIHTHRTHTRIDKRRDHHNETWLTSTANERNVRLQRRRMALLSFATANTQHDRGNTYRTENTGNIEHTQPHIHTNCA